MRVSEFENAILRIGLNPKEVRLEKNQVKWFVCDGNGYYDIIVYDAKGKALALTNYEWPEEVNDVKIETYYDKEGKVLGVTIDGKPVMRDRRLDLVFAGSPKMEKNLGEKYMTALGIIAKVHYVIAPVSLKVKVKTDYIFSVEFWANDAKEPLESHVLTLEQIDMVYEAMCKCCYTSYHSREEWGKVLEQARDLSEKENWSRKWGVERKDTE